MPPAFVAANMCGFDHLHCQTRLEAGAYAPAFLIRSGTGPDIDPLSLMVSTYVRPFKTESAL
jgi:hypothetical protein